MGGAEKTGRWRVGERLTTVAVMGGNDIDLRHAEIDADEVTIGRGRDGWYGHLPSGHGRRAGRRLRVHGAATANQKHPVTPPWSTADPRPGVPLMGGIDVWRLPEEAKGVAGKQARKLAKKEG